MHAPPTLDGTEGSIDDVTVAVDAAAAASREEALALAAPAMKLHGKYCLENACVL
jgi:hypothetical protein